MARRRRLTTSLVAAASRPLVDRTAVVPRQPAAWQAEAWTMFDEIGEVKYACNLSGNALAKLRLFVAVRPGSDLTADPVPVASVLPSGDNPEEGITEDLAAQAEAELTRLKKASDGEPELLRSVQVNLEVAGELYLVGWEERTAADADGPQPERWEVRSVSEVRWATDGDRRTALVGGAGPQGGKPREVVEGQDAITRVWVRHPRFGDTADSNLRGVMADCRALLVLQAQAIAEARSRMSAGGFTVPNELTIETPQRPGQPDDPDSDPFMLRLEAAMIDAVEDPASPAAVAPFIIRGPAEYLKPEVLRPIVFGRGGGAELEQKIEARVQRLARGMNLPPEVVLGHQQTTYANAEQVDEDTFEDHYEPRARLLVDTLTVAYLRPALLDKGFPPELVDRVFVWYDASALLSSPDVEDNADAAFDRGAISLAAYRRVKGYDEGDAPDVLELLQRAGLQKGQLNGQLTAQLLNLLAGPQLDVPTGPEPGGAAAGMAASPAVAALLGLLAMAGYQGAPDPAGALQAADGGRRPLALAATAAPSTRAAEPPGRQLLAIDTDVRARLQGAIDSAVERALERAGNRVRAKAGANRRALARVLPRDCCAVLGPDLVAAAGIDDDALIEGAFGQLEREFRTVGGSAQKRALGFASKLVGNLPPAVRDEYGLRQAKDLDQAWDWLHGNLRTLTKAKLWNPDVADPDLAVGAEGEFDPTSRTPTGLLRQALRQAGGAKGALEMSTGGEGDAWVSVPDGQAPGGIATGQLVHEVLVDNGGAVEGYRWVYGPAARSRPYLPHLNLDGLVFTSFTDDRLANLRTFPGLSHYLPGDHRGCICDVEPIILTAEEAAARGLQAIERKKPKAPVPVPPDADADPPGFETSKYYRTAVAKADASRLTGQQVRAFTEPDLARKLAARARAAEELGDDRKELVAARARLRAAGKTQAEQDAMGAEEWSRWHRGSYRPLQEQVDGLVNSVEYGVSQVARLDIEIADAKAALGTLDARVAAQVEEVMSEARALWRSHPARAEAWLADLKARYGINLADFAGGGDLTALVHEYGADYIDIYSGANLTPSNRGFLGQRLSRIAELPEAWHRSLDSHGVTFSLNASDDYTDPAIVGKRVGQGHGAPRVACYYSPAEKRVVFVDNPGGSRDVVFHEVGHAIDNVKAIEHPAMGYNGFWSEMDPEWTKMWDKVVRAQRKAGRTINAYYSAEATRTVHKGRRTLGYAEAWAEANACDSGRRPNWASLLPGEDPALVAQVEKVLHAHQFTNLGAAL